MSYQQKSKILRLCDGVFVPTSQDLILVEVSEYRTQEIDIYSQVSAALARKIEGADRSRVKQIGLSETTAWQRQNWDKVRRINIPLPQTLRQVALFGLNLVVVNGARVQALDRSFWDC